MYDEDAFDRRIDVEDIPLLAAVVLLPWAFGGVEPWAFHGAALLIAISAAIALVRDGWSGWGLGRRAVWLAPAFALLAWGLVQLVPMPVSLLAKVSPRAHAIYDEALMLPDDGRPAIERIETLALSRVPEAEGVPLPTDSRESTIEAPACLARSSRPISLQPSATAERVAWFGALLLAFLLIRVRVADPGRVGIYLASIGAGFAALAVVGLLQAYSWNGKLLWIREIPTDRQPFGPYVNQVHFGGLMELGVPFLFGAAWSRLRRLGRDALIDPWFVLSAVGGLACVVAGLGSASKAAAALIAASLVTLGLITAGTRKIRLAFLGVVLIAVVLLGGLLGGTKVGERLGSFVERAGQGQALEGRSAVWEAGLAMLADFPLTGAGFGSFAEVFPRYQPPGAVARWMRAHNDYLELLLDGGAIAGLLVLWLSVAYGWRLLRRLRAGGWSPMRTGLALGVASLAAHASIDFNHQVPANALLFVAVAALASEAAIDEEAP